MALTQSTVLTAEVFAAIAAELLLAVDDVYIYAENGPINRALEAPPPGASTVSFNKPVLPTGTYTEASRRMTEGTDVDSGSIAISLGATTLTIREYGGPHDGTAVRPFGITEKMKVLAKHNLVALIGNFLRRDRVKFLNTAYRDLLLSTTTVVTADGSTEATIAAGKLMSLDMMRVLNKTMKDAKVPTFPNGHWRFAINTRDELNMKRDAEIRAQFQFDAATSPTVRGYFTTLENFDLITDTLMPTSLVGVATDVTSYQGLAWGPYGIGHEPVMAPEPRMDPANDFGRRDRIIWLSYDALGLLYPELVARTVTT